MKNFAEFFAGVGLVREGLAPNGWSCVWANDISIDKFETYSDNFGNDHFSLADIWDIASDPSDIPDDAFLFTASFPCTDLSVAGGRAGLAGAESGTINALFKILEAKHRRGSKPSVVLLENVRGFLTSHCGNDVAYTVRCFTELGYFVDIIELDAIDFSAQSRPRVFMIAVEEELALKTMKLNSGEGILDVWSAEISRNDYLRSHRVTSIISKNPSLNWGLLDIEFRVTNTIRLCDIVEKNIPEDSPLWWNDERKAHVYSQMSQNHINDLKLMVDGEKYSYGTVYRRMRKGKSMAEMRTDGFAGCLRTPRGGSSKQFVIQAGFGGWKVRLLTPREYARLQGVRDSFKLPDNANKSYFAMGDAVCVPVIDFIGKNILNPLYDAYELIEETKSSSAGKQLAAAE